MGTATRNTNQSGSAPLTQATIDQIRGRITVGAKILGSDLQTIRDAFNTWNSHTHDYFDQVTLFDFGNVDGGSSSQTLTSGGAGTYTVTSPTNKISATVINEWQTAAVGFQNHFHDHSA